MLALCVSNLGVGGSWCYNRVNVRVERNDKGHAGVKEVLGIRCGEGVVAKCRIPAGGVHGGGVLVERGVRFGDAEEVWRPVNFADSGVWETLTDFSGSSVADAMMWAEVVRHFSCWTVHRHLRWISSNNCQ